MWPTWTVWMCTFNLSAQENDLPQDSHLWSLRHSWTIWICAFKFVALVNNLSHVSHLYPNFFLHVILILENSHFNLCIMINNFECLFNFWLMMNIFFMLFKAYSSGIRVLANVTNIFFQIFMNNFYMILKIVWSGKWFITPITFMNFFFLMNIFNMGI